MPNSDHFDGHRFFNPTLPVGQAKKSFFKGMSMWLATPKAKWPKKLANHATPNFKHIINDEVAVTFVNHVTFVLQFKGFNVLTDPMWSKRASPFRLLGPKRVRKPGVEIDSLPQIDLIIISHNHYDHLDVKSLKKLNKKFAPIVIVPLGNGALIKSLGFTQVHELDWWETKQVNTQINVTLTPMQHWSARTMNDQYKALWGSYVIESAGKKIFFGGDGGYCTHFADIYTKFGSMDLALLGIGAYEPRWFMQLMHTNPEEAVKAHLDLHAKQSIGMHFNTFQLSAEAIDQPVKDLQLAKNKYKIADDQFIILAEGQTKLF